MKDRNQLRDQIHEVIFEADTPLGKRFDITIMVLIVGSVLVVMLESVESLDDQYHDLFKAIEWIFTIIFTIEYALRLYSVRYTWRYASSFYGIVDFLAIIPTYLTLLIPGTTASSLLVIRALRLMRVFRIFKLGHFMSEGRIIMKAMQASRTKISVFLFFILIMVTIIGSVMYLVEGAYDKTAFTSIPKSVYWAIVTLTTVGFGDITPQTSLGQFLSAVVMILGYAVIAVPTGIVSSELIEQAKKLNTNTQACRYCSKEGHDDDAEYCKYCGNILNEPHDH
ncbi:MAG: ion transporter [Bacteroidota bacterium]